MSAPFEFRQCINILKATGLRTRSLRGLRQALAAVSEESIYYHTYQYFLKGHVVEYTNDFAEWVGRGLEESALAEGFSNIDPYLFPDMESLRAELLRVIDQYLERFPEPREAMPGEEFHFSETITIVFPLGLWARNLAELLIAIKYIDPGSLYFHFYEARNRLKSGTDDFSSWVEEPLGKAGLARRIRAIDPFMHTIEGIRGHLIECLESEVQADMGGVQA